MELVQHRVDLITRGQPLRMALLMERDAEAGLTGARAGHSGPAAGRLARGCAHRQRGEPGARQSGKRAPVAKGAVEEPDDERGREADIGERVEDGYRRAELGGVGDALGFAQAGVSAQP